MQIFLNPRCERVRAAKHAPRDPFRVLEHRHGLAEIVEVKLANVFLLGNAAPNNARKGIVGWFPLVPKDVGGSRLTGELKLRFHLKRAHLLEGLDEACRQELIAHPAAYIRVLNRHTSYEPAAW